MSEKLGNNWRHDAVVFGLWLMVAFSEGWSATPLWQRILIGLGFLVLILWPAFEPQAGTKHRREVQ
jgi:hypothetical protein